MRGDHIVFYPSNLIASNVGRGEEQAQGSEKLLREVESISTVLDGLSFLIISFAIDTGVCGWLTGHSIGGVFVTTP
jgi:hypothetical protein